MKEELTIGRWGDLNVNWKENDINFEEGNTIRDMVLYIIKAVENSDIIHRKEDILKRIYTIISNANKNKNNFAKIATEFKTVSNIKYPCHIEYKNENELFINEIIETVVKTIIQKINKEFLDKNKKVEVEATFTAFYKKLFQKEFDSADKPFLHNNAPKDYKEYFILDIFHLPKQTMRTIPRGKFCNTSSRERISKLAKKLLDYTVEEQILFNDYTAKLLYNSDDNYTQFFNTLKAETELNQDEWKEFMDDFAIDLDEELQPSEISERLVIPVETLVNFIEKIQGDNYKGQGWTREKKPSIQ